MSSSRSSNFVRHCRKIIGIGRNYKEHAAELNNPLPKQPLLFLKPPSSMVVEGQPIVIPEICSNVHHEVELGVVIGKEGAHIHEDLALDHVAGYTLALDMTSRDQQNICKNQGLPWVLAKCWDTFCPVSEFIHRNEIPDPQNVDLWLKVNGELRQSGNTKDMVFPVAQLITYCSSIMKLEEGDLILTGTPSGVGAVKAGDVIECGLKGIKTMKFQVE